MFPFFSACNFLATKIYLVHDRVSDMSAVSDGFGEWRRKIDKKNE